MNKCGDYVFLEKAPAGREEHKKQQRLELRAVEALYWI